MLHEWHERTAACSWAASAWLATTSPLQRPMQVAALHSQLAETQQARHSLAVRLASLQAQLRQPGHGSGGSPLVLLLTCERALSCVYASARCLLELFALSMPGLAPCSTRHGEYKTSSNAAAQCSSQQKAQRCVCVRAADSDAAASPSAGIPARHAAKGPQPEADEAMSQASSLLELKQVPSDTLFA